MTNRTKITMARARLRRCGRTRGRAVGQRGAGARTEGATERAQDVDRAPALQRLGRQADARRARRADDRGCTARGASDVRRCQGQRRADDGPDGADVRAGVPRRLRRTMEARDAASARGRHTPAHTADLRQPARLRGYGEGRAQLVRRSLGHAGSVGEPDAGSVVVADEARGSPRPAARRLQPVQGTAAAQDRLRGALPDGRRVRRARSGARRRRSRSFGRRCRGALPALHRRAQVRGAAAQVGAHSRRPRGAARFEDQSPHDLARIARSRFAGGAATAHQLPLGVRIALRRWTASGTRSARRRTCRRCAFTISGIRSRRSRSTAARACASSPGCSAMPTLPRTPCSMRPTGSRAVLPTCSTAGRRADD